MWMAQQSLMKEWSVLMPVACVRFVEEHNTITNVVNVEMMAGGTCFHLWGYLNLQNDRS